MGGEGKPINRQQRFTQVQPSISQRTPRKTSPPPSLRRKVSRFMVQSSIEPYNSKLLATALALSIFSLPTAGQPVHRPGIDRLAIKGLWRTLSSLPPSPFPSTVFPLFLLSICALSFRIRLPSVFSIVRKNRGEHTVLHSISSQLTSSHQGKKDWRGLTRYLRTLMRFYPALIADALRVCKSSNTNELQRPSL